MSCPDRRLLSVYADGELDSPWKEKVDAHIASCPACQRVVSSYASLSGNLFSLSADGEDTVLARMRVSPPAGFSGNPARDPGYAGVLPSLWKRRMVIPLPLAGAAALVLTLATAFAIAGRSPLSTGGKMAPAIARTVISAQPASFEDLVRSIDAQGGDSVMTIVLPGETSIQSAGDPVLMTASSASGGFR